MLKKLTVSYNFRLHQNQVCPASCSSNDPVIISILKMINPGSGVSRTLETCLRKPIVGCTCVATPPNGRLIRSITNLTLIALMRKGVNSACVDDSEGRVIAESKGMWYSTGNNGKHARFSGPRHCHNEHFVHIRMSCRIGNLNCF